MTEDNSKPIWVRHPISILFDIVKLQKTHPWDIDLKMLLDIITAEIRRLGYIEFEASGVALLSSSIIFRRKSELLLKLEEPPKPPEPKEELSVIIPPPLNLPLIVPHGKISLSDLAQALMAAILTQMPEKVAEEHDVIPPLLEQPDEFMVNLEKHMKELQERIQSLLVENDAISFSYLVEGMKLIDVVRTFIILLFLTTRGFFDIYQEDETKEIWIGLRRGEVEDDGSERGRGQEDN
ncbi:MAG: hypothetical protein ACUVTL_04595 [Thermoproteota archaeon]